MLTIDPSAAVPIWKQIEEEMRRLIGIGVLEPGDVVPSVRDLARELRVNPATVSKAYQRLSMEDVLVVKRGEGTFVADTLPVPKRSERRESLQNAAERFVGQALALGAGPNEIEAEVGRAMERLTKGSKKTS